MVVDLCLGHEKPAHVLRRDRVPVVLCWSATTSAQSQQPPRILIDSLAGRIRSSATAPHAMALTHGETARSPPSFGRALRPHAAGATEQRRISSRRRPRVHRRHGSSARGTRDDGDAGVGSDVSRVRIRRQGARTYRQPCDIYRAAPAALYGAGRYGQPAIPCSLRELSWNGCTRQWASGRTAAPHVRRT